MWSEITEAELFRRAGEEGINLAEGYAGKQPTFVVPVWNESAGRAADALSARVSSYAIIRSDGTAVLLVRCPEHRDESIFRVHTGQVPTKKIPDDGFYARMIKQHFPEVSDLDLPAKALIVEARERLPWPRYVSRMMFW